MDALKALQLLHGACDAGNHIVDVELHNLVGIIVACVRDGHLGRATIEGDVAIVKGGIAESEAKGIKGVVAHIEVVAGKLGVVAATLANGTACGEVVIVEGLLTRGLGHRGGELATGHFVAKQHITDGIARLAASEPHLQDGGHMVLLPRQHGGAACEVEYHHGLAQRQQGLEEFSLHVKHLERGATAALATHLGTLAHGADNHVGILGDGEGLALQGLAILEGCGAIEAACLLHIGVAGEIAALGTTQGGATRKGFLHGLLQRGILIVGRGGCPGASHILAVVGHRTNEGYPTLLLQG